MAELFSQYGSGLQFTAGTITGSALGISGLNPLVDRLNSISTSNNLVTGSFISGTNTIIYGGSMYAGNHSVGSEDMLVNVCYGTGVTPPAANTTTEGALYIQYTA